MTSSFQQISAICQAENEIIEDKLKQGINGVEWLVLQTDLKTRNLNRLYQWLQHIGEKRIDLHGIVVDALTFNHKSFHGKYSINYWISLDESISYLALARQRDYNVYWEVMQMYDQAFKIQKEDEQ